MSDIVILIVAAVALSTVARGHPDFVPHPTERLPLVTYLDHCHIVGLAQRLRRLKPNYFVLAD